MGSFRLRSPCGSSGRGLWRLWSFPLAEADCSLDGGHFSESRRRISLSCERLRALLPQFDGRREDMASILEMSVQFLRLAGGPVPGREQHAVSPPASPPQGSHTCPPRQL